MSYRYTRLTRTIRNSGHDKRHRRDIEAMTEFKEGSRWHILEGGTDAGLHTHGKDILYYGLHTWGAGPGYVHFLHPDYESLLAAMEDREPTNTEFLVELGLSPDEVIELMDREAVKIAAAQLADVAKEREA